MAANVYECMVLFDSNKYAGNHDGVVNQIHGLLDKHHCTVLASRPWDDRRLAYPVAGHKKGMYYLIYFQSEGGNLIPLEQDFRLSETIVRYLLLRIDPKMVDKMLELAKDEHAVAMQAPGLADEPTPGMPPTDGESH